MTVLLKANQIMTLTAAADTAGSYYVIGNPGDQPGSYVPVNAGGSATVGPFNTDKNYKVDKLTVSISANSVHNDSISILTSNKISDLTALGQTLVANIGNSATGTQIAIAVNGILAILIVSGLMKSS